MSAKTTLAVGIHSNSFVRCSDSLGGDKETTLELTMSSGIHLRLVGVSPDFVLEILKTLS